MWQMDAAVTLCLSPAQRTELLYARAGEVRCSGQPLPQCGAIELRRGERLRLQAGPQGAQLVGFSLPRFEA